jgi:hypothetical protein
MKKFRIISAILLLGLPTAGSYLSNFKDGYFCEPDGLLAWGCWQLIFSFVTPILAGITIGCVVPVKRIVTRVGVGLGAIFLSGFLIPFAVPGGAIAYSHGFEDALRTQVGIERLQQWSQKTLVQYQSGQIKSAGESYFTNPGDVLISTNDLPAFLKTGVFKPIGLPIDSAPEEPEVSVCKAGGRIGASQNCIAISWHSHGVLIGSPNFTNEWIPWYCKEIAPGVYSYYEMD